MAGGKGYVDALGEVFTPVHREGYVFIAGAAALAFIGFLLSSTLGVLLSILAVFMAYFFRDPARVTPMRDGLVIAAADGKIVEISNVRPPMELGLGTDEHCRISTHLGLLDVHVNRSPVAGRVVRSIYIPGAFNSISADKDSDDNERRSLVIETPSKAEIAVVQIAGMITRRIATFAYEGDSIGVGERFGLIRFGSRVDVYLPAGKKPLVCVGQRTVAGETVLADFKSDEAEREARRS